MVHTTERVNSALAFNCPECDAGISEFCRSVKGKEMAQFVHHSRIPQSDSEFDEMRLAIWFSAFGNLLDE